MKRALLIVPLMLLVASASPAQLPPVGYIGLFTDAGHDAWCVTGAMPFYSADVWSFCLPSEQGQRCAEFALSYPESGVIDRFTIQGSAPRFLVHGSGGKAAP